MEDLRLAFLVIGGLAIVGILIHGMWSVRKNSQDNRASLESPEWDDEYDDIEDVEVNDVIDVEPERHAKVEPKFSQENEFDELGIGAVRVVTSAKVEDGNVSSERDDSVEDKTAETDLSTDAQQLTEEKQSVAEEAPKPKIYSSVVTQPKPEFAAQQIQAMRSRANQSNDVDISDIPEPPPFLLKTGQVDAETKPDAGTKNTEEPQSAKNEKQPEPEFKLDETPKAESETVEEPKVSLAEQAKNFVKRTKTEAKPKTRRRKEPKIREDQMRIDFDEPAEAKVPQGEEKPEKAKESQAQEQEVLIINVRASDDKPIQGSALLPMLLTLGFKFGEQDIFHRHVNSNGKGPVLFSLANMLKPGVFDIDNLENFSTLGVSLFMMLPIEGDPHQVFNMMHNAARKIADEFDAQVLDGRRSALTKQSLQQYVEKIREFERKRRLTK